MKLIFPTLIYSLSVWGSTSVTNLGSLHDLMLNNPNYSLKHFVSAILAYRPEIIYTEARVQAPGVLNATIDGGIEQSIVYALAEEIGAKVVAIDSWDKEFYDEWAKEMTLMQEDAELLSKLNPIYLKRDSLVRNASLIELNNPEQKLARSHYKILEDYSYDLSSLRDERICHNLRSELDRQKSLRAMTIFGLDHKFRLDDCVRNHHSRLVHINEWYKGLMRQPRRSTVKKFILNLRMSFELLKKRINENYYSRVRTESSKKKAKRFVSWIDYIEKEFKIGNQ